jgi:hypothetical protein
MHCPVNILQLPGGLVIGGTPPNQIIETRKRVPSYGSLSTFMDSVIHKVIFKFVSNFTTGADFPKVSDDN